MKLKRILALALCMLMLVTMLAGCKKTEAPAAPAATEEGTAAPAEKTRIVYWHTYTDQHEEALNALIDAFNESQDEYEFVAEQQPYSEIDSKIMQSARNGTAPDLVNMFPSDAVNYINEGLLYDFGQFLDDPEIGIENFKEDVPAGQYAEITQWGDGGTYIFPCTTAGEVLFYNKTMFDKYELAAPTTWSELEECSKVIFENEGIAGFGTDSVTDTYQCLIMQAGSGYINPETSALEIDETIAKEKLNWFADGVKAGYFRLVGEDAYFSGPFGDRKSVV